MTTHPLVPDRPPSETPPPVVPRPESNAKYIWAVVVLVLLGGLISLGVLFVRPGSDPLLVLGAVGALVTLIGTAVAGFLKAQEAKDQAVETHLMVNSRLKAWMDEHAKNARNEALLEGAAREQARVAEQRRLAGILSGGRNQPPESGESPAVGQVIVPEQTLKVEAPPAPSEGKV